MADPCGTGGVARYLDRLGDQAGPASPLAEAEGQPWHPPLSCPSRVGDREGQESGRWSGRRSGHVRCHQRLTGSNGHSAGGQGQPLEAKDSEIAGLKEAFEIALSAKDSEIASLREQFERGMAYLDAERSRADELRGRLDDLGGKLSDAQTELAAAQDQIEALDPGRSRAAGAWRAGAVESSMARRVTAGRRPMADFTVTMDVIKRISEIETPHGKALNEDITEAFPDNPDAAYTLAVGFSVATLLGSFSDPSERANVVDGVNVLVRRMGCALTPVT